MRFAASNQFIWWSHGKLGEGIHKPVQSCVVMEVRWKRHCQLRPRMYHLGILIAGEVEEKEELVNKG